MNSELYVFGKWVSSRTQVRFKNGLNIQLLISLIYNDGKLFFFQFSALFSVMSSNEPALQQLLFLTPADFLSYFFKIHEIPLNTQIT